METDRRIVYTYRTRSRHSSGRSSYGGISLSSLPRTWLIDRYSRWSIISWSLSWMFDLYKVLVCNLSNSIDGTSMQVKNRTLHVCSHKRYINYVWYYRFTYFILWHMALYYNYVRMCLFDNIFLSNCPSIYLYSLQRQRVENGWSISSGK